MTAAAKDDEPRGWFRRMWDDLIEILWIPMIGH